MPPSLRYEKEHWDVIQDEATKKQSKSGLPMFGNAFPPESAQAQP
jgi:hypothetical protein